MQYTRPKKIPKNFRKNPKNEHSALMINELSGLTVNPLNILNLTGV